MYQAQVAQREIQERRVREETEARQAQQSQQQAAQDNNNNDNNDNATKIDNTSYLKMFEKLINLGFDSKLSMNASNKFPNDLSHWEISLMLSLII